MNWCNVFVSYIYLINSLTLLQLSSCVEESISCNRSSYIPHKHCWSCYICIWQYHVHILMSNYYNKRYNVFSSDILLTYDLQMVGHHSSCLLLQPLFLLMSHLLNFSLSHCSSSPLCRSLVHCQLPSPNFRIYA